jgi:hypothetical protein
MNVCAIEKVVTDMHLHQNEIVINLIHIEQPK